MTTYSAESPIRRPGRFLRDGLRDLAIARRAGRTIFLRSLQSTYRQNVLGYVWVLIPAVVVTLTWVFLGRTDAIDLGETAIPYAAYVGTGVVLWQLFLDGLTGPLHQLTAAREVLRHARLPHESWMVAAAIEAVFKLVVRCVPLSALLVATGALPGTELLLFPLAAAVVLVLGLAIGVLITPAGLLYTDITEGLTLVATFGFFLTPIVYPSPSGSGLSRIIELNPVTPVVVTARAYLTGSGDARPAATVAVGIGALIVLVAAVALARLARPHVVARL